MEKVKQTMKSVCLSKYGFKPSIKIYENNYDYHYKKQQEQYYWKIKRPAKTLSLNQSKKISNVNANAIINSLPVHFFDCFKNYEQIKHKKLVQSIMLETGYKERKTASTIKKYIDLGFIIAGGNRKTRFYFLSAEGERLIADTYY